MTKVDIVSGFLGAGKTTFIKKLVSQVYAGEKLVLIENEFGEIGIDGGFLRDAGIEVTEMNSGCICCTLVGDFSEALKKVLAEYQPDRVLIEPSGVGKLSDVAKAVEAIKDQADIAIGSLITVVDGKKAKMYMKNFGEFFNNQVEHATTIVLSRTQMMTGDKLDECVRLLKEKNGKATIITTAWDALSGEAVRHALEHSSKPEEMIRLDEEEEECGCGHGEHHHDQEVCHDHGHNHEEHHHDHECGHNHEEHHDHGHDHECGHGHEEHHHEHECGHEHEEYHHDHECGHDHGEHDDHECGHNHEEHHHEHECGHGHEEHHHDHECGHGHEEHHHHHECGHDHGHHHDHHGHHHHHADEVFTSWGTETAHLYDRQELEAVLKDLAETATYGTVLRAKGIVAAADGSWLEFDLVPMEYQIRAGQPDYTGKLCVIGTDLAEDALKKAFHI